MCHSKHPFTLIAYTYPSGYWIKRFTTVWVYSAESVQFPWIDANVCVVTALIFRISPSSSICWAMCIGDELLHIRMDGAGFISSIEIVLELSHSSAHRPLWLLLTHHHNKPHDSLSLSPIIPGFWNAKRWNACRMAWCASARIDTRIECTRQLLHELWLR